MAEIALQHLERPGQGSHHLMVDLETAVVASAA